MTDWTTEKGLLDSSKSMAGGVNLMMPGIWSDRTHISDTRVLDNACKSGLIGVN